MSKIERTFVKEIDARTRAHAEIGFRCTGGQGPYFYALAGVEHKLGNGRWESECGRFACCADHKALQAHFPEYAGLARWHLSSIHSGPMHYEEDAIFWAEMVQGKRERNACDPDPVEAFKHTVVWGAAGQWDGDAKQWLLDAAALCSWLHNRKDALMARFRADVEVAFPALWSAAAVSGGRPPQDFE